MFLIQSTKTNRFYKGVLNHYVEWTDSKTEAHPFTTPNEALFISRICSSTSRPHVVFCDSMGVLWNMSKPRKHGQKISESSNTRI